MSIKVNTESAYGRVGRETIAIIELAIEYLEYLGYPNAAIELLEVYETDQDIEYNTQIILKKLKIIPKREINQRMLLLKKILRRGVEVSYY